MGVNNSFRITDVRVKLVASHDDKLIGYCTLTINNAIAIKDIKIINSETGPFVAMPSRRLTRHCSGCNGKNHLKASFCNDCGVKLEADPDLNGTPSRERVHFDVVHPINSEVRAMVHDAIIKEVKQQQQQQQRDGSGQRHT